jgi:TonB family protein
MALHMTPEEARGWTGAIGVHVLLALLLLLWDVPQAPAPPEYIEMSWGTFAALPVPLPATAGSPGSEGASMAARRERQSPVDLPEQAYRGPGEGLPAPDARKLSVDERPRMDLPQAAASGAGRKERGFGEGSGERAERGAGAGVVAGDMARPDPTGTMGADVGSGVSVSMQWSDGGVRRKLSGDLPEYPEGTNVQAQIKIEAVVTPDGAVRSLKPAQKGNTRLEEAAMKAVRLWRFEPLRSTVPQREQTCLITFNFRLQ